MAKRTFNKLRTALKKRRNPLTNRFALGKTPKLKWNYNDEVDIAMKSSGKDIITGVGSFDEYITQTLQQTRFLNKQEICHNHIKIISSNKNWKEFIDKQFGDSVGVTIFQTKQHSGWVIWSETSSYLEYYNSGEIGRAHV